MRVYFAVVSFICALSLLVIASLYTADRWQTIQQENRALFLAAEACNEVFAGGVTARSEWLEPRLSAASQAATVDPRWISLYSALQTIAPLISLSRLEAGAESYIRAQSEFEANVVGLVAICNEFNE